jgi:mannose-1-phosphate guanylyltransferase/mannose-6-phosphate isomerase
VTVRIETGAQPALDFQRFVNLGQAAEWYDRWARSAAMPLWWTQGADRVQGGFHEALSAEGQPRPGPRRARVQSRQVYAYATAGAMNWDGPWREAAWHGMDFFLDRFRRTDGLFRTLVGSDGRVLDDTAMLYDQAFALLATATLHRMDPRGAYLSEIALEVLNGLQSMRHPAGGFRENIAYPFQANAHMHILEGALAWAAHGLDPCWDALADEIVEMTLRTFIDPRGGFLREFFDPSWKVAAGNDGRLVEPGHQFEWAWLLESWGRRRGREDAVTAARGLYASGRRGIDAGRDVVLNELWDDFTVRESTARLWPQTERLKAELLFGSEDDQVAAAESLRRYLATPVLGVWRDKLRPDGSFIDEPAPATSFYHILCACTELFRVAAPS